MKIYFENGQLLPPHMLPFRYDHHIDAGEGYSFCEEALRWIKRNEPESVVYTNMITALSNFYAWNMELKAPEIYMRNDAKKFVRIDELHGNIRMSQNVMAMYRAGMFGNIPYEDFEVNANETMD